MKHIKIFEEQRKSYWSIKKDKYILKKSLEKLGVPEDHIRQIFEFFDFNVNKDGMLYVSFDPTRTNAYDKWYVSTVPFYLQNGSYRDTGEVYLSKKELEEIELERKLDKYNI